MMTRTQTVHDTVVCSRCGRSAAKPPLTWTHQVSKRGHEWLCDTCTRDNLRAIEGNLDSEWW